MSLVSAVAVAAPRLSLVHATRWSSGTAPPAATAVQAASEEEEEELMGHEGEHEDGVIGRQQLVRPTLWEQYSAKVRARMENPVHRGAISPEEAEARGCNLVIVDNGSEACGDALRLFWAVHKESGIIVDARFQTFGCATAIAASDATAELCIGKTVEEARKAVTSSAVEKYLRDDPETPAVPPQKMHCSVMASEIVKKAAESSGAAHERPQSDDDVVVCDCAQVTVGAVRRAIREHGLRTVSEVMQATKAGAFCGSCRKPGGHERKERYLLDVVREERARARVVKALDEVVAPVLGEHSGSVEVLSVQFVDVKDSAKAQQHGQQHQQPDAADGGPMPAKCDKPSCACAGKKRMVVRLAFRGACSGCHSAGSTLSFVQDALRRKLSDPTLVVRMSA
eukprot:m51a1_g11987 scaffold protein NifU (396) ;mRNA; r:879161-880546